jgi:hypothetical protein
MHICISHRIATIIPIAYLSSGTNAPVQTADSWFDVKLNHAYFYATAFDNVYQFANVIGLETLINMDAFNQQSGARIEYFEIIYYTDDVQLLKVTSYTGANSSYIENPQDFITLSREKWFSSIGSDVGGNYMYDIPLAVSNFGSSLGVGPSMELRSIDFDDNNPLDEKYLAILSAIENKQTIYVDIIRAGYTSFDGNEIIVTYTNIPVIQRLELIKNGHAFTFGRAEDIEKAIAMVEQRSGR